MKLPFQERSDSRSRSNSPQKVTAPTMAEQAANMSKAMLHANYVGEETARRVGPGLDYYGGGRRLVRRVYPDGSFREYYKYYTPQQQAKRRASAYAYRQKNLPPKCIPTELNVPLMGRPDFRARTETPELEGHEEFEYSIPAKIANGPRPPLSDLFSTQFSGVVTELRNLTMQDENALHLRCEGIHPMKYKQPFRHNRNIVCPAVKPLEVMSEHLRIGELFDEPTTSHQDLTLIQYCEKFFPRKNKHKAIMKLDELVKNTIVPLRISQTGEPGRKLPNVRDDLRGIFNAKFYVPHGLGKSTCKGKWPDRIAYLKDGETDADIILTNRLRDCHPKDTIVILPTYHRFMANCLSRSDTLPPQRHKEYLEIAGPRFLKILIPDDAFLSDVILALDNFLYERMP